MKPQNIVVDTDTKQLQISWENGHSSIYDFVSLRRACPCAECQPWKEGVGEVGKSPPSVFADPAELKAVSDVVPVGSYAIQFLWASGHIYGIYTWDYMLEICPCDEHAGRHAPGGADTE